MTALLTPREIKALVARLVTIAQPEKVIMFGSYAKGRASAHSDLDLLVVLPADPHTPYVKSDLQPYLRSSVIPVDLHIVTADEFDVYSQEPHHFLQSIRETGRVLYGQDPSS